MTSETVVVSRLRIDAERLRRLPAPLPTLGRGGALLRCADIPIHFYRYLYGEVGREHQWTDRLNLSDERLADAIRRPEIEIHVLLEGGCPAGFFEWSFADLPESAELLYFGLLPEFIGKGRGRYMLCNALAIARDKGVNAAYVSTCSLDHPHAILLYQKLGFEIIERETRIRSENNQ